MKTTKRMLRKGFTLVELLVVIAIIVALAGLATPAILKQIKEAHTVQATSNARQVYTLLMQFGQDWDSFPDDTTAPRLKDYAAEGGPTELTGTTSNAHLRQLIAGGYVNSEDIFYTKGPTTKKPDNAMKGSEALKAGEVGFGYILINDKAQSTSGNAGCPVLVTPLKDGASGAVFDLETFNKKAVVLRLDGSAMSEKLTPAGKVLVGAGKDLLDTGTDSVWGDKTPKLNLPIPK
jgi:prepilin-type N-terminal cleavage/methylation domain-containing protein